MLGLRFIGAVLSAAVFLFAAPAQAASFGVIDAFSANNGDSPSGGLIADASGALYGTTNAGGNFTACQTGCGTVFRLVPPGHGSTGWTQTVLYAFGNGSDGGFPAGALIADAHGVLYGTTTGGGDRCEFGGCGTVFALTPPAAGKTAWTERVLHRFMTTGDGHYPQAGLLVDARGNLYGTTQAGGGDAACGGGAGCGTVFKLAPPASGATAWTETLLHSFTGGTDGQAPSGALLADAHGALYGSTEFGGSAGTCGGPGCGAVFKLTPPATASAAWRNTILHAFNGMDGLNPTTNLIADARGNLYGSGGSTVFELAAPAYGRTSWTAIVLHAFNGGNDGQYPNGGLIADSHGALYGTTSAGGPGTCACGTVFKLAPAPGFTLLAPIVVAAWNETLLHVFSGSDGENPSTGLTVDGGTLFGAAIFGGNFNACPNTGCGTVFRL